MPLLKRSVMINSNSSETGGNTNHSPLYNSPTLPAVRARVPRGGLHHSNKVNMQEQSTLQTKFLPARDPFLEAIADLNSNSNSSAISSTTESSSSSSSAAAAATVSIANSSNNINKTDANSIKSDAGAVVKANNTNDNSNNSNDNNKRRSASSSILLGRRREVFYPETTTTTTTTTYESSASSAAKNNESAFGSMSAREWRLAKRANIDYHAPESPSSALASKSNELRNKLTKSSNNNNNNNNNNNDDAESDNASIIQGNGKDAMTASNGNASLMQDDHTSEQRIDALRQTESNNTEGSALQQQQQQHELEQQQQGEAAEELPSNVIARYPISPYGKLYFQIETDGATRLEAIGIIIIDTEENAIMMYDRVGRQYGNRPEPGYPLASNEVENAKAGVSLRVGGKVVKLITALTEESFRSGEFFLRSEHDMRIKEDKMKAVKDAAAAAAIQASKPKMSFGQSLCGSVFAAQLFRKRPRDGETGFVVPLAGRPKLNKQGLLEDLTPLHDPDRENAMVLFRADYKRDSNGRRQVSVVVDPVIGDKLRPHQRAGVKFLFDCIMGERMPGYHGAILADEMGLGKTIQTVATIYTCLKQGKHGGPTARKCLVVTPSSLVKNWCNEFDKWLGAGAVKHFAISESTPKGDRIISRFDGEGEVLVISYDQLRKYITRICTLKAIELVVCDEGHRLKNSEVKTTKAVDMLPTRNRIILSGTPIQNDLSEFHAMVGFVNPGILGNRDLFARVFEEPVLLGRDPLSPDHVRSLGHDRAHYLATLTQKFILRRTQTINESYLPPKVDVTVFVRLGSLQEQAYRNIAHVVESASCTPLVLISALRKLCNHLDLFMDAVQLSRQQVQQKVKAVTEDNNNNNNNNNNKKKTRSSSHGKRDSLNNNNNDDADGGGGVGGIPLSVIPKGYRKGDLTQESGSKIHFVSLVLDELRSNGDRDKLVIVSNFTQTLDIIAALCKVKKIAYFQLDGSTPIKKRQELVDYFNVPGSQELVFLLSSKAGGVGLNLIGANRLILFDPDWNPANDAQAMGRVWRDGQKKRVFIYRLLSTGTIEEKIYQRQVSKQGLSANVVDMQEDSKQHFTLEELKSLFKYKHDTYCETHDLLSCLGCEAATYLAAQRAASTKESNALLQLQKEAKMKFRKVGEKKGGPRMDELKAWRHIADVANFALDKVTRAVVSHAPTLLSFLFADERDNTKKPIEKTLKIERAFAEDEDAIICASQAAMNENESQMEIELHDSDDDSESESVHSSNSSDED